MSGVGTHHCTDVADAVKLIDIPVTIMKGNLEMFSALALDSGHCG